MRTASTMKTLGEDILTSYDMRAQAMADRVGHMRQMLTDFQESRRQGLQRQRELADDLHKQLRHDESLRLREGLQRQRELADDLHKQLRHDESLRLRDGKTLLKNIRSRQRDRNQEVHTLLKNIRSRQRDRNQEVHTLAHQAREMLRSFQEDNEGRARDWREIGERLAKKINGKFSPESMMMFGAEGQNLADTSGKKKAMSRKGRKR
ncbi:MAG: hypothetical protein HYR55_10900 [Acidobacteria bacterium]|nr:hypothetical protein [Acidobacteriota bacterium]MBI3654843.1 hypothetical protein [Acidobacteriota bacterium]